MDIPHVATLGTGTLTHSLWQSRQRQAGLHFTVPGESVLVQAMHPVVVVGNVGALCSLRRKTHARHTTSSEGRDNGNGKEERECPF